MLVYVVLSTRKKLVSSVHFVTGDIVPRGGRTCVYGIIHVRYYWYCTVPVHYKSDNRVLSVICLLPSTRKDGLFDITRKTIYHRLLVLVFILSQETDCSAGWTHMRTWYQPVHKQDAHPSDRQLVTATVQPRSKFWSELIGIRSRTAHKFQNLDLIILLF